MPHGSDRFAPGRTVGTERGPVEFDVTIEVDPGARIIEERLVRS
ncbi:hypothetical protein ACIQ1S_00765 [Streptomyces griseus]